MARLPNSVTDPSRCTQAVYNTWYTASSQQQDNVPETMLSIQAAKVLTGPDSPPTQMIVLHAEPV